MNRRPFALANWKMAMTIAQSLAFVREFLARARPWLDAVEVVLCPPYTALAAVADAVQGTPIAVGGQDLWPGPGLAHTGAISAELLADAGATWVMVGHWEVRRRLREDDGAVNRKVRAALEGNLRPILLFGEAAGETFDPGRLAVLLDGCDAGAVARMAFVYEPEGAIGQAEPVSPAHAAAGCRAIRRWLADRFSKEAADQARVIYGGSVTPEHAAALLADPDVDGLGATRRGRDPVAFADIVAQIAARRDGCNDVAVATVVYRMSIASPKL